MQAMLSFNAGAFLSDGRSIEHADFDGTERLALVLDGDIVSTFDTPDQVKLGECALIEEARPYTLHPQTQHSVAFQS